MIDSVCQILVKELKVAIVQVKLLSDAEIISQTDDVMVNQRSVQHRITKFKRVADETEMDQYIVKRPGKSTEEKIQIGKTTQVVRKKEEAKERQGIKR